MDKIIPLNKGIHRQPSVGTDGELSELVNLIPQNGELVNVRGLKEANIILGQEDVYIGVITTNAEYNVYIATNGNNLKYVLSDKGAKSVSFQESKKIQTVNKIERCIIFGNCVAYYAPYASYLLFSEGEFISFDDIIADVQISFGLQSEFKISEEYIREYSIADYNDSSYEQTYLSESGEDAVSYVNGLEKDGKFVNPFFVRYAYRMFDNSIKYQSAPVLMPCCNKYGAIALRRKEILGGTKARITTQFKCYSHDLYYTCLNSSAKELMKNYVRAVEVYVCPVQFVRNVKGEFLSGDQVSTYFSYSSNDINVNGFAERKIDKKIDGVDLEAAAFWDEQKSYEEIEQCAPFFKLATMPFPECYVGGAFVKVPSANLLALTEVFTENPNEYFRFDASSLFTYNNRVLRGNIKRLVPSQYSLMQHVGCSYDATGKGNDTYEVMVVTSIDGKEQYTYMGTYNMVKGAYIPYIFFPYKNVTKILLKKNNRSWYSSPLKNNIFQYGSFAFDGNNKLFTKVESLSIYTSVPIADRLPNTIQLSDVNTPFVYKPINEVSVGNGEVIGISTASKALSQGQFGQFPLYVFCTDGIWALEIASDGTFSAKQPISRDVCNNPDSITQIDGAVVFTTDQGLKLIQGSEVILLSGHLDGHNVDEGLYFKKAEDGTGFFQKYNMGEFDKLVNPETRDIRDILRTCRISYDYTNQLLRIFPKRTEESEKNVPYKYYVYSFTTQEFATVIGNEFDKGDGTYDEVTTVVPDYPSSVVQIGDKLYRPVETEREGLQNGLLLTRPLLFDEPFALKKLQDMRLHYSKFDGTSKCHVIVYVSNDGNHWMQLKSLRRRSYKYYRFAIITDMKDMDALSGMVLRYEVERNNKLR